MAILSNRTHTLRGPQPTGIGLRLIVAGIDRTDDYEALSFGNNSPGGYGPCQFILRKNPPNFNDTIFITINGQEAWNGTVANTPGIRYVGEKEPTYNVIGDGPGKTGTDAQSSNFAMAFVDKNLSNWFQIDCKNWSETKSALQLDCSSGDFLRIGGSDTKFLLTAEDVGTVYGFVPEVPAVPAHGFIPATPAIPAHSAQTNDPAELNWKDEDFPTPPILWAAYYYVPNQGVTDDVITLFECDASWNLLTPLMDDMTFPDWDAQTEAYDASKPPKLLPQRCWPPGVQNMWTGLYGVPSPTCLFGGIYAVNTPEELPVRDARAMYDHPALVHLFNREGSTNLGTRARYVEGGVVPEGGQDKEELIKDSGIWYWTGEDGVPIWETPPEATQLSLPIDGKKMLVFYMAYRPIKYPKPCGLVFDEQDLQDDDDGVYKLTTWTALNRFFLEGNMFVQLDKVAVYCNGFTGNDLSLALNLITPGEYPSFVVDEYTSIMVEPFTTKLGAVEALLQLYPQKVVWGYWHNKTTLEASMGNYGTIYFDANEPGVSVEATLKKADADTASETVGGMTVVYSKGHGSSDNRTIHAWTCGYLTIDADGNPLTVGTKSGYLDLSGTAHSGESAVGAGISFIEESGGGSVEGGMQWEGTIGLRSIYGAALVRAGYLINCGDVTGAMITSVSVDVDGDKVTLSLGGTGYQGRFAPSPGLGPSSATPFQSRAILPLQSVGASRRG
jgi:hypothetical protein